MKYSLAPILGSAFALASLAFAPAAFSHDERGGRDSREVYERNPRGGALRDELRHTRGLYDHVQDEIASFGSNKHLRAEMSHINEELNHVDEELGYRSVDPEHIRAEVAHIHDELHHVEGELHDRGSRESDSRDRRSSGGFTIRIR